MTVVRTSGIVVLATCILAASSAQAESSALSPREVAQKYDEQTRLSHTTLSTKYKLSTCRYKVEGAAMQCVEKPRVRVVENVLKYYGRDVRSLGVLTEPVSDTGIGMLMWQYYETDKDNDSWLFLPALNKVRRVVVIKDSRDSGSYFGTEFYVEDLEWPKLDQWTFKLLGEENVRVSELGKGYVDAPAYVLEWTPKPEKVETTNYGRMVTWIDKERFILLKEELYDHDRVLFKRRSVKDLELLQTVWMPKLVTMDNLATRRVTVMAREGTALNFKIQDEYFTQRTLTDHAYRERQLSELRALWTD